MKDVWTRDDRWASILEDCISLRLLGSQVLDKGIKERNYVLPQSNDLFFLFGIWLLDAALSYVGDSRKCDGLSRFDIRIDLLSFQRLSKTFDMSMDWFIKVSSLRLCLWLGDRKSGTVRDAERLGVQPRVSNGLSYNGVKRFKTNRFERWESDSTTNLR